jgi:hypothetical protein
MLNKYESSFFSHPLTPSLPSFPATLSSSFPLLFSFLHHLLSYVARVQYVAKCVKDKESRARQKPYMLCFINISLILW